MLQKDKKPPTIKVVIILSKKTRTLYIVYLTELPVAGFCLKPISLLLLGYSS